MTLSSESYKGTRDLYPEDKQVQNHIFSVWNKVSQSFGYQEYGAPLIEPIEVYRAKSGQELVNEQTYTFVDRGDREVAIRPEMTPTISRMVAGRRQELGYPARLYSVANFMRYERPQKGREREFWQLNADIFGDDSIYADLEILNLSHQVMLEFGANESMFEIRVNDRRFISYMLNDYLGLNDQDAHDLIKLLDQKHKLTSDDYQQGLKDILKDQTKVDQMMELDRGVVPSELTQSPEYQQIQTLLKKASALGIKNAFFDIYLMRGLDYYTGTVFEVFDTNPDNRRSLFGGGRYDGLVALFGAEPISAVGVAPGASTCWEFLVGHNLLPKFKATVDGLIIIIDDQYPAGLELASQLRQAGIAVEIDYTKRKLAKQIKSAEKRGVSKLIFVGETEAQSKTYQLKSLTTSQTKTLSALGLIEELSH